MKCLDCQKQFKQAPDDLMPAQRCPDCRMRIILSFRNERSLHQRKCDLCKKDFVGTYKPDSSYTVYCASCWWSDKWDPFDYGLDYDPNKKFIDQFVELYKKIPHLGMNTLDNDNCDFTNYSDKNKNCYLIVNVAYNENLYYSERALYSKDSLECNGINNCQLCYGCLSCRDCYDTQYSEFCENLTDCSFCYDCKSSQNCFGCFGLRNQKYYFLNKK